MRKCRIYEATLGYCPLKENLEVVPRGSKKKPKLRWDIRTYDSEPNDLRIRSTSALPTAELRGQTGVSWEQFLKKAKSRQPSDPLLRQLNLSHSFIVTVFRLCAIMATVLFTQLTWAGIWKEWGVTCEREPQTIKICDGKKDVTIQRCRGRCRSLSRIIMASPWYRTLCECCKSTGYTEESITCPNGKTEKIRHVKKCTCQRCHSAR